MKNWLKVLNFTLKQAVNGSKFIVSTILVGVFIIAATAVSNVLLSGVFDDDSNVKDLKAAYVINETGISIDSDSFVKKHQKDYPFLNIKEISGISGKKAASDSKYLNEDKDLSVVLEITEDKESSNLTIYIPEFSKIDKDDAKDFGKDFAKEFKNSKIKNTNVSEEKLNMAISDLRFKKVIAEESDSQEDHDFLSSTVSIITMVFIYVLVIIYGQNIGQIISMEKTSKLMEYILTLTGPSGIIFGKVTAIFCEAVIQVVSWILCGIGGFAISNVIISQKSGTNEKTIISAFMDMLPEGGISNNFIMLLIVLVITMLFAFLFYCCVSALFASFAATAEELSQTNSLSIMFILFGFFAATYIPMITDNSEVFMIIMRIVPFTAAFVLPGDIVAARIGIVPWILYMMLLIFFTVMLAILTGRVYKNRLFKRGTKGIFAEIVSSITGKTISKTSDFEDKEQVSSNVTGGFDYAKIDKAKKAYTIVGFALLALTLGGQTIGGLIGNVIANLIAAHKHISLTEVYKDTTNISIINIVIVYCIACPLCALVMKFANDSVQKVKGHVSKSLYIRSIFAVFPVSIALSYFSTFLASILSGGEAENATIGRLVSDNNILAMIMVSVLAPIFEELVFRKLIIDRTRRYGEVMAIVYSALAFGLFHCNIYQFFYAFAMGIIFGYIYVRSGNIIMTIVMHMIVNTSTSVLYPLSPQLLQYFQYVMSVLGTISIIYTIIKKDISFEKTKDEVIAKELSPIAFLNSGSVLFAVISLFITAYSLIFSH